MPGAHGLGGHLAEQVHLHGVVDGDHVAVGGDDVDVVDVVHRGHHKGGVAVDKIVQPPGAGGKGEHRAAPVQVLVPAGELARLGQVHHAVGEHLGVDAQILQIGLGQQSPHCVGHAADAQLEACPVGDEGDNLPGHRLVLPGGLGGGELVQLVALPLHHHVHPGDVDGGAQAAEGHRHPGVDLHNDGAGPLQHGGQIGGVQAEAEKAVVVHGGDLDHGHVHPLHVLPVIPGHLGEADGGVVADPLLHEPPLNGRAVPGVPGDALRRVGQGGHRRLPQGQAAPEIQAGQLRLLRQTLRQGPVQVPGHLSAEAVVNPVPGPDAGHRLPGGTPLFQIQFDIIHAVYSLS